MGSADDEGQAFAEPAMREVRELRRGYHDRIAALREASVEIVRVAVGSVGEATRALLHGDAETSSVMAARALEMSSLATSVDGEVVEVLALESPVARDLRVILTARDVAQIGLLCVGLCGSLAERVTSAGRFLGPPLQGLVEVLAADTARALDTAAGAWTGLDTAAVQTVFDQFEQVQCHLRDFLAAVVGLTEVPVEAAIDLGLAARVYQRLGDHAVEIAERVVFAAEGITPGISRSAR